MRRFLFNVSYDNDDALKKFGEDKKLADSLRNIYVGENLRFPSKFRADYYEEVRVPDDADVELLKLVEVPEGMNVDIKDPGF